MKCPHCGEEIADETITAEAARISGKKGRRKDGGGKRCPVHGIYLTAGRCKKCEKQNTDGSTTTP